jgi:hypothetical protein
MPIISRRGVMSEISRNADAKQVRWPAGGISFGVGCFHFGLMQTRPPERLTVREYVNLVADALNAVQTINNVAVGVLEGGERSFSLLDEPPKGVEWGDAHPFPHFFRASFNLYIPRRIQKEFAQITSVPDNGAENFLLYIAHSYASPIAFVVPQDANGTEHPSESIPVVREYLRKQINVDGAKIRFESLGPSPFHANFKITSDPTLDRRVKAELIKEIGYARVDISVDPGQYESITQAFEDVRYQLSFELDVFYSIIQSENRLRLAWSDVQDLLRDATEESTGDWLSRTRSYFVKATKLRELHSEIASFEAMSIRSRHATQRLVRRLYDQTTMEVIKPLIESALEDREVYPIEQVGRLVDFMERRQSKAVELLVVLIAAVIGGVAGALLTVMTSSLGG